MSVSNANFLAVFRAGSHSVSFSSLGVRVVLLLLVVGGCHCLLLLLLLWLLLYRLGHTQLEVDHLSLLAPRL